MNLKVATLLFVFAFICLPAIEAKTREAKISDYDIGLNLADIEVLDGDTLKINWDRESFKVRLADIDAPEMDQKNGQTAAVYAAAFLDGKKEIILHRQKKDRYGRYLGSLTADGKDMASYLVGRGWAWVYCDSRSNELRQLEASARYLRCGLWADDEPLEPWNWRLLKRIKKCPNKYQ